jgi:hypothetical protein
MKRTILSLIRPLILTLVTVSFWGCPSTPPKSEKKESLRPELSLQIASIDLAQFSKRIERKHITELAKALKREQIEVLAVQGIARYPGVSTRTDFVDELTKQTDWRNVFGEMVNASGRQTGNAIFSSYPILSHYNETFDKVKSANFDAAIQATVDAGVRSVVVVSTQLPAKATSEDQRRCLKLITALNPDRTNPLTIVAGNLPSSATLRTDNAFTEVTPLESSGSNTSKIWYTTNSGLQLITTRTVETELGSLVIVQLGLFRQK